MKKHQKVEKCTNNGNRNKKKKIAKLTKIKILLTLPESIQQEKGILQIISIRKD